MLGALITSLVLTVSPASANDSAQTHSLVAQPTPKSLQQWRDEVHAALKQQALAKDLDQPPAVARLVALSRELEQPLSLPTGEQSRLHAKLRTRLVRLRTEVPLDIQVRQTRINSVTQQAAEEKRPELLEKISIDQAVLAQWNNVLGQMAPPAAGGGNGALDDGQRLVELIQDVVTPDIWNVNGGPGAVVYYPGLHSLVVSATSETHEETLHLLNALRQAGN